MGYLLAAFYFILFLWWFYKSSFFEFQSIKRHFLLLLLGVKLIAGFSYDAIYTFYYTDIIPDTKAHFIASGIIYKSLVAHAEPIIFTKLLFGPNGGDPSEDIAPYVKKIQTHWDSKSNYAMLRYNAVMKLFSFGHFPVHLLFHNIISFIGLLALFKLAESRLNHHLLVLSLICLFPSALYWTSGLHKDGFALALCCGFLWWSNRLFMKYNIVDLIFLLISVLLLWEFRSFYLHIGLLLSLPLLLQIKLPRLKATHYIMSVFILGVFASYIIDLPSEIQIRQSEASFFTGNSDSDFPKLEPNWSSILENFDEALIHLFISPILLWDTPMQIFSSLDSLLFILIASFLLYFALKNKNELSIQAAMLICFSLCIFLLAAYTTVNLGSLVRYKAAVLPLFFMALCQWGMQKNNL